MSKKTEKKRREHKRSRRKRREEKKSRQEKQKEKKKDKEKSKKKKKKAANPDTLSTSTGPPKSSPLTEKRKIGTSRVRSTWTREISKLFVRFFFSAFLSCFSVFFFCFFLLIHLYSCERTISSSSFATLVASSFSFSEEVLFPDLAFRLDRICVLTSSKEFRSAEKLSPKRTVSSLRSWCESM